MSRNVKIQLVGMTSTTPARSSGGNTDGTSILPNEIGVMSGGSIVCPVLVVGYDTTDYFIAGSVQIPHTFTIEGNVAAKLLPGFFPLYETTGNANFKRRARLLAVRTKLGTGTATIEVRNGGSVVNNGTINVTTTATTTTPTLSLLTHEGYVDIEIKSSPAPSGATNLSVTLYVQYY